MKESLVIKRTHIDFDEKEYTYLNKHSDFPINHKVLKDEIFTKLCHNLEEYNLIVNELKETLNVDDDVFEILDNNYFKEDNLIIMFSDERSSGNKLTLKDIYIENNIINVLIERERGLTMDMSYLFLFIKTSLCANKAKAIIETKTGGLF